jgi:hypothetical protein
MTFKPSSWLDVLQKALISLPNVQLFYVSFSPAGHSSRFNSSPCGQPKSESESFDPSSYFQAFLPSTHSSNPKKPEVQTNHTNSSTWCKCVEDVKKLRNLFLVTLLLLEIHTPLFCVGEGPEVGGILQIRGLGQSPSLRKMCPYMSSDFIGF